MIKKILFSALLPSCIFLAMFLSPAASAKAQTSVVKAVCMGPLTLMFSPALGFFQKQTHMTGSGAVSCVFSGDLSRLHYASVEDFKGSGNLSCLVNTETPGSFRFEWDDHASSVVEWKFLELGGNSVPAVPRVFVLQGKVVSGKFQGSDAVLTYHDIPNLDYLKCLHGALDRIDGLPTGTITQSLPE